MYSQVPPPAGMKYMYRPDGQRVTVPIIEKKKLLPAPDRKILPIPEKRVLPFPEKTKQPIYKIQPRVPPVQDQIISLKKKIEMSKQNTINYEKALDELYSQQKSDLYLK